MLHQYYKEHTEIFSNLGLRPGLDTYRMINLQSYIFYK